MATANLLHMSVPDPSTTFVDIGLGDSSMYEDDDPFSIENLLPSNFGLSQLDSGPNATEQALMAQTARESSLNLAKHALQIHLGEPQQPQPLFPMMRSLEPLPAASLRAIMIKAEQDADQLSIKCEDAPSASYYCPQQPASPPASSPLFNRMGAYAAPSSASAAASRMRSPGASRKKSASLSPEEEELTNVPTLQMRIKILQQRVSLHIIFRNCSVITVGGENSITGGLAVGAYS
jgi:hypothetical protein